MISMQCWTTLLERHQPAVSPAASVKASTDFSELRCSDLANGTKSKYAQPVFFNSPSPALMPMPLALLNLSNPVLQRSRNDSCSSITDGRALLRPIDIVNAMSNAQVTVNHLCINS